MQQTWNAFVDHLQSAHCGVIVLRSVHDLPPPDVAHKIDQLQHAPLLLSTPVDSDLLPVAGMLRFDAFISIGHLESDLRPVLNCLLRRAPRRIAADVLLRRSSASGLTRHLISEVLLSSCPVSREADLAARLHTSKWQMQYTWRRDMLRYGVRLQRFCQWGRTFRAAEMLSKGVSKPETAMLLGIDESTLYRDLRRVGFATSCNKHEILTRFVHDFGL